MLAVLFNRDFQKVAEIAVPDYMREYLLPVMDRPSYYIGDEDSLSPTFDVLMRRFIRMVRLPPTDEESIRHYKTGKLPCEVRVAFLEDS
jgi:hypothetical protein